MNPELPQMVRYAADRDIRTVTSTNGHFFHDEAYLEGLLKSGLSTLIVAIDSVSTNNYETYRRNGDLDSILSGVDKLIALKKRLKAKTLVNIRMVVMKQNENEIAETRSYAKKVGADCFTVKTLNPGHCDTSLGENMLPVNPRYRRFTYKKGTFERNADLKPCYRIWHMSNILSNGDVVPCTYDYDASMKVGNIFEMPYTEIWNGPGYRQLRKKLLDEYRSIPRCAECAYNFEQEAGMFAEFTRFRHGSGDSFTGRLRNRLLSPQVRHFVRRLRRKVKI